MTLYLYYVIPKLVVDHYNTTHPIHESFMSDSNSITYDLNYRDFVYFKGVKYHNDDGYISRKCKCKFRISFDDINTKQETYPAGRKVRIANSYYIFTLGMLSKYGNYYK